MEYIFRSERLGFRNWMQSDIALMAEINADPQAMTFFPSIQSFDQTQDFVERMDAQYAVNGYCYFAVDDIDGLGFIGFIGLSDQRYEADFTPCIDIGWRLHPKAWGRGFATEGASRCLTFAFEDIQLDEVVSVAPCINHRSINVMQKIGMKKVKDFIHPILIYNERLRDCVLYAISKP
jgi:RimJ/RimL family protein N-acetyltransferase